MAAAGLAVNTVYGAQEYWPEKKLRICVTGAGGFIASHLAKRLKQEGHYIVGCDWKRNEHMPVRPPDKASSTQRSAACARARRVGARAAVAQLRSRARLAPRASRVTFVRGPATGAAVVSPCAWSLPARWPLRAAPAPRSHWQAAVVRPRAAGGTAAARPPLQRPVSDS